MRQNLNIKSYKNIRKIIVIAVFLTIIFIVLNFFGFSNDIKNFFFSISSPIQKSLWQAGKNVSDFANGILESGNLKKQSDEFQVKNQELLGQIVALKELAKENENLRKALGLELEKEFKLTMVQVISKDISQDSILINKGGKDGVLRGLPVITAQKALIGKIGEVYDNFSEVILISNKKSSFDAKIINNSDGTSTEEEVYGIIKGQGNFNFYFDLIPKDKEIFEKDIVVTSVLGGVYPQGLLVGEVKTINKSDIESFKTAEITPFFDIENLDYLYIIVTN